METKFQTSFIPKKPITQQVTVSSGSSVSVFFLIAVVLFIGSICAAGGIVVWQKQLNAKQLVLKGNLDKQKKQFDSDFLSVLKQKTAKIAVAKELLNNHLSASDIFNMIGAITVENTRYKSFHMTYDPKSGKSVELSLGGEAKNYETIAYQADVLAENKYLHNAYLSSPQLQTNGYVNFNLTGTIEPRDIKYINAFAPAQPTPSGAETAPVEGGITDTPNN